MPLIPKPRFPSVPKLPGVPQVHRFPTFPAAPPRVVGGLIAAGRLWQALFTQSGWGVYKHERARPVRNNEGEDVETVTVVAERSPVVQPDSFLEFGYAREYNVSDYPVQDGGFASYDKVANPFDVFVRMSKGGSLRERAAFLESIDAIQGTIELYDIVTPEKTYLAVNVTRHEVSRRGNRGAYFFAEVDLYFREIREVSAAYSTSAAVVPNAQDASATPVENTGLVQGQDVDATPESFGISTGDP